METLLRGLNASQSDYFLFLTAFFLLNAGLSVLRLKPGSKQSLCWRPFGIFFFIHSVLLLSQFVQLSFGHHGYLVRINSFLVFASTFLLLDFVLFCKAAFLEKRRIFWYLCWIGVYVIFALAGREWTVQTLPHFWNVLLGVWAAIGLWRESGRRGVGKITLGLSAASFLGYLSLVPAAVLNDRAIRSGAPVFLVLAVSSFVLAQSLFLYSSVLRFRTFGFSERLFFGSLRGAVLGLLCVLLLGWGAVQRVGSSRDREQRLNILSQSVIAAASFDTAAYRSLKGVPADLTLLQYRLLRRQLFAMGSTKLPIRWFYTVNLRDSKVIFVVDSVPEGEYGHTESGTEYEQPPVELLDVFKTGKPVTVGPYTDEWGTYISAFVPLWDPVSREKLLGVFCVDVEAADWARMLFFARFHAIVMLGLVLVMTTVFLLWLQQQLVKSQVALRRFRLQGTLLDLAKRDIPDEDAVMETITREISRTLAVERVSIWLLNADKTELRCRKLYRRSIDSFIADEPLTASRFPSYFKALSRERSIVVHDALADERTAEFKDSYLLPNGIVSMLDTSLWSSGEISGVLSFEHSGIMRSWQDDEVAFAVSAAEFISGVFAAVERRRAEARLQEAFEQLKATQAQLVQSEKMASIGLLAGGVAHEINNPLTGVINNLQLIKLEAAAKSAFSMADFQELLAVIEESAMRCKKIAQSLLDFSRSSREAYQSVSLNEIIEKVVGLVKHEFTLKNIEIELDLDAAVPFVQGEPQLLQQVVLGLMVNARWAIEKKHAAEGGTVRITSGLDTRERQVVLSFSDSGIGIPPQNLNKIFAPFFTTKEVGEGTGLGLALSYSIVKRHGGSITVESSADSGTTFRISLPVP